MVATQALSPPEGVRGRILSRDPETGAAICHAKNDITGVKVTENQNSRYMLFAGVAVLASLSYLCVMHGNVIGRLSEASDAGSAALKQVSGRTFSDTDHHAEMTTSLVQRRGVRESIEQAVAGCTPLSVELAKGMEESLDEYFVELKDVVSDATSGPLERLALKMESITPFKRAIWQKWYDSDHRSEQLKAFALGKFPDPDKVLQGLAGKINDYVTAPIHKPIDGVAETGRQVLSGAQAAARKVCGIMNSFWQKVDGHWFPNPDEHMVKFEEAIHNLANGMGDSSFANSRQIWHKYTVEDDTYSMWDDKTHWVLHFDAQLNAVYNWDYKTRWNGLKFVHYNMDKELRRLLALYRVNPNHSDMEQATTKSRTIGSAQLELKKIEANRWTVWYAPQTLAIYNDDEKSIWDGWGWVVLDEEVKKAFVWNPSQMIWSVVKDANQESTFLEMDDTVPDDYLGIQLSSPYKNGFYGRQDVRFAKNGNAYVLPSKEPDAKGSVTIQHFDPIQKMWIELLCSKGGEKSCTKK